MNVADINLSKNEMENANIMTGVIKLALRKMMTTVSEDDLESTCNTIDRHMFNMVQAALIQNDLDKRDNSFAMESFVVQYIVTKYLSSVSEAAKEMPNMSSKAATIAALSAINTVALDFMKQ